MAQAEAQVERLGRLESGVNNGGGEGREAGAGPLPPTNGGAGTTPIRPGDGLSEPIATIPLLAKTNTHPGVSSHAPESLRSQNRIPGPKEHQNFITRGGGKINSALPNNLVYKPWYNQCTSELCKLLNKLHNKLYQEQCDKMAVNLHRDCVLVTIDPTAILSYGRLLFLSTCLLGVFLHQEPRTGAGAGGLQLRLCSLNSGGSRKAAKTAGLLGVQNRGGGIQNIGSCMKL